MKKTVVITIIVDDVEITDLSELAEEMEAVFDDYEFKRIDMSLGDTPMVKPIPTVTTG